MAGLVGIARARRDDRHRLVSTPGMLRRLLHSIVLTLLLIGMLGTCASATKPAAVAASFSEDLMPVPAVDRVFMGNLGGVAHSADSSLKAGSAAPMFSDSFEDAFIEPPLQGNLRFTRSAFSTPLPTGTQLDSLSEGLNTATSLRFLQADTGLLGRVLPNPTVYANRLDFDRMSFTPGGVVEARLTAVDLSLNDPSASTSGCETSDFNGFPAGHIALIQRGTCSFAQKASNAEAAGAVGVIIFNQGTSGNTGLVVGSLGEGYRGTAPVISVTFDLGLQWATGGAATFRMRVDSGQRNGSWELIPVARPDAGAKVYWIRNSVTGELLAARRALPIGSHQVSSIKLDNFAPDDQRAWWVIESSSIRNFFYDEFLATIVSGGSILLLTTSSDSLAALCPDNTCAIWNMDEQFLRPPAGTTRLRSAVGALYLQQSSGDSVEVVRVKQGWPNAQWILEPVPNTTYRRLLNLQTGKYVNVQSGSLQAGAVEPGWWSAMWTLEPATEISEMNIPGSLDTTVLTTPITHAGGYYRLRNRWTGQLLNMQNGLAVASDSEPTALHSLWVMDDLPIPPIADVNLRGVLTSVMGRSPSADIYSSEAAGLYQLTAADAGIVDLGGMQYFSNLVDLRLPGNAITDVASLATLTELNFLDLSRNPIASIAGLEASEGLADGDHINLLRTSIGQAEPTDGAPLLARQAIVLPGPGLMALHHTATGKVIDTATGRESLVEAGQATNEASWSIEYDVGQDRFRIRLNSYFDPRAGYLTWNDQDNRLEFGSVNLDPEWRFELVATGQYRIRNTRLGGAEPYLQICNGDDLDINQDPAGCSAATWYIDGGLIQNAISRAQANYYDPKFAPSIGGYTRIQNTRSREFLNLNSGAVQIAQVLENATSAQWKLVPVGFDSTYFFAIQNRSSPSQYLYRDGNGALLAGPLPGGVPNGATWATVPANQPFLFALDGTNVFFIQPLQDRANNLRANAGQLSFASASRRTVWHLDGGVKVPAPSQSSGFIQLQQEDVPLYAAEFSISWRQPTGPTKRLESRSFTGPGNYIIPADAKDIRARAVCVGCGFGFSDVSIFDLKFDRPPNRCYETRGPFIDPHYGTCDPAQGSMAVFAANAAEQLSCAIVALGKYVPSLLDQLAIEDVSNDLIDGDFEHAQQTLFNQGDLSGPDFSGCNAYETMSFGAGASAGIFGLSIGGGIGIGWGLTPETAGVVSYTSTGSAITVPPTLISVGATTSLGLWVGEPKKLKSRAIGFSLQGNREVPLDLKKLKKIGVSAGLTLWFECDSGSGPLVNSTICAIREDSNLIGFTFDLSTGVDVSLPLPGAINLTYAKTCVPANFSGNDCH